MLFPECSTQENIEWTSCPCLGSWIKPCMFQWLDTYHHLSQWCLVSLYRGHVSILRVHVLSFFFHQVRSAARKRWHRWQDHHSLRVRVARAMSIPTSPTRISFHSIKQTAAVWYARTYMHHLVAFRVLLSSLSPSPFLQCFFLYSALLSFAMRCPSYFCGLSSPILVMLL